MSFSIRPIFDRAPVNISEQAPGKLLPHVVAPLSATGAVGTHVRVLLACDASRACAPSLDYPPPPPLSSVLHCGRVSTTSKQSGSHPAPIPRVGVIPPLGCDAMMATVCVAPQASKSTGIAIVATALILLWLFVGALMRKAFL